MNWIIYNRVSTDEQWKSWVSLEYQRDICIKFAKDNKISIDSDNIFQEIYSWAFLDRPQLSKVFNAIKKWNIDCIIILRRDRLARDTLVFGKIREIFDNLWIQIYYPEETLSGDEIITDFLGNTLVGFSQFEKWMIFKRTYTGKKTKASSWKWVTAVPYWYIKNNDKLLELYEPEVKTIKLIVKLYLEENLSISKIVDYLNSNKILPPSMSTKESATQQSIKKWRKNAVTFWWYSSVVWILDNIEKYYLWEYKAFATIYKKIWKKSENIGKRSEDEIIKIKIPKIYTKVVEKKIAEKRINNKSHSNTKRRVYLLRSKLYCDCCTDLRNFTWYTWSSEAKLKNYRCSMSDKRKTSEDRRCTNSISGLKIDNLVIDILKDFFLDYSKFKIEYWLNSDTTKDETNIIDQYKFEIKKLDEKDSRALDLALDWLISKEKLKEVQNEIIEWKEKYNNLIHNEYELVYNEYKQSIIDWDVQDYVDRLYHHAQYFFENSTYEELKQVVDLMIDKVIVSTDKSKPVRVILNVYPWEFDIDTFFKDDRSTSIIREYNKEKTHLGEFQVEFSSDLKSEDYKATDWWDYKFIKLLKKLFLCSVVNGTWWTHRATIPGPIA